MSKKKTLFSNASLAFVSGCLRFGSETLGSEPPRNDPKPGANVAVGETYKKCYTMFKLNALSKQQQ